MLYILLIVILKFFKVKLRIFYIQVPFNAITARRGEYMGESVHDKGIPYMRLIFSFLMLILLAEQGVLVNVVLGNINLKEIGMAEITIVSQQHKDFSVYVDNQPIDNAHGNQISFEVQGGFNHYIEIHDGDYVSSGNIFCEMYRSYRLEDENRALKII